MSSWPFTVSTSRKISITSVESGRGCGRGRGRGRGRGSGRLREVV